MRTLLCILLMVSVAEAQEDTLENRYAIWADTTLSAFRFDTFNFDAVLGYDGVFKTVAGKDTTRAFAPFSAITIFTIINLYDLYAKECWNDSTEVTSRSGYPIQRNVVTDSLGLKHLDLSGSHSVPAILIYSREWVHREPTFTGFIGYLKSRIEMSKEAEK